MQDMCTKNGIGPPHLPDHIAGTPSLHMGYWSNGPFQPPMGGSPSLSQPITLLPLFEFVFNIYLSVAVYGICGTLQATVFWLTVIGAFSFTYINAVSCADRKPVFVLIVQYAVLSMLYSVCCTQYVILIFLFEGLHFYKFTMKYIHTYIAFTKMEMWIFRDDIRKGVYGHDADIYCRFWFTESTANKSLYKHKFLPLLPFNEILVPPL